MKHATTLSHLRHPKPASDNAAADILRHRRRSAKNHTTVRDRQRKRTSCLRFKSLMASQFGSPVSRAQGGLKKTSLRLFDDLQRISALPRDIHLPPQPTSPRTTSDAASRQDFSAPCATQRF
ncbi:hypothetical protein [Pseudomonas sp. sia0905]|uniref:hypothetical protein n=1 Tax=Pseudomonas sp. sia0905 TaxID=2854783 RepID=UPI001C445A6A|nr:hypothetical protein [Pseudomonas sp. sia0905]MBV7562895.1 hypothetical protein [Pseudomonas sp. sia0905]